RARARGGAAAPRRRPLPLRAAARGADADPLDRRGRRGLGRALSEPRAHAAARGTRTRRGGSAGSRVRAPPLTRARPTYNRARYLGECLRSALVQGFGDFEIVVADDGSTDETADVVASLRDPRLRYLRKAHSGAPDTRNLALDAARGTFLFNLDSDDV